MSRTIEEIIEAVERCSDDSLCTKDCPYWEDGAENCRRNMLNDLKNFVENEKLKMRKKGLWIIHKDKRSHCSVCGMLHEQFSDRYCGNCGAYMTNANSDT